MFKELKKLLMPRKLWMLRLYIALLTLIVEFLLGAYVLISIYNLITSDNALGDLVLGYAGLYLVWVCLAILFVIQVVSLFLNIHDNIEDVRNKAINPAFAVDLKEEKEKSTEASLSSIGTIAIIVLSIILSFVNLNRNYSVNESNSNYSIISPLDETIPSLPFIQGRIVTNTDTSYINRFKTISSFYHDLDGDGKLDVIEIMVLPIWLHTSNTDILLSQNEPSFIKILNALIVVNDQFVELPFYPKGGEEKEPFIFKIIDIDKSDNFEEITVIDRPWGEDPPGEYHVIRYINGILTLTKLPTDKIADDKLETKESNKISIVYNLYKDVQGKIDPLKDLNDEHLYEIKLNYCLHKRGLRDLGRDTTFFNSNQL